MNIDEQAPELELEAGDDVPADFVDDAERDAIAAAAEKGEALTPADIQADMLAAMNGVEQEEAEAAKTPEQKATEAAEKKAADELAAAEQKGKDEAALAAGKKPDEPPVDAAKAEAEDKAASVAEADEMKLKGKTRERFLALTDTVRDQRKELTEANTKIETLLGPAAPDDKRPLVERLESTLKLNNDFIDAVINTGMTASDFQNVAGYKMALSSNDPVQWQSAHKFLSDELAWLETNLMKTRSAQPGVALYEEHADLKDKVERAQLSTEDADEMARLRNVTKAAAEGRVAAETTTVASQAAAQASQACITFAEQQGQLDPQRWQATWPTLQPKVAHIRATLPPQQWEAAIALEYSRIPFQRPAPAPVAAPTRPPVRGIQPARGGSRPAGVVAPGSSGMQVDNSAETPFEALQRGMREEAEKLRAKA